MNQLMINYNGYSCFCSLVIADTYAYKVDSEHGLPKIVVSQFWIMVNGGFIDGVHNG